MTVDRARGNVVPISPAVIDVDRVRQHFPALGARDDGRARIYLDNPAGTQVPRQTIDRVADYYRRWNANLGGAHPPSLRSDEIVAQAHAAMADFLGAASPREIVFGPNMTTLAFAVARSLRALLRPGDEILLSRLDHDANVRPWEILAEEKGLVVRRLDFDPESGELDLERLDRVVGERTRLAAVGYASNLLGTVNDVAVIARRVRAAGGLTFVDAVHYGPHGPIDVAALGCDLLACSPYKFFGPHLGVLWAREELLERLPAYKVRAASDELPGRFETGTQPHELHAGLLGTFEYLEWLGREATAAFTAAGGPTAGADTAGAAKTGGRRALLRAAMAAIQAYERELTLGALDGLRSLPRLRLWGLRDPAAVERRVPTFALSCEGRSPGELAHRLAARGVLATHGTGYAISVVERLGLEREGGVLRLGFVHYNTAREVDRVLRILDEETS